MKKYLLYIIISSIFFRLIFFIAVRPWDTDYYSSKYNLSDQLRYITIAENLNSNGHFSNSKSNPEIPENIVAPAYPYLLSILLKLFHSNGYLIPVIISMILSIISTLLITYFIRLVLIDFNIQNADKMTLIGGIIAALDPVSSYYSVMLMTENLYLPFFILSLIFIKFIYKCEKIKYYIILSVASAGAILTRPSFLPTVIITFLLLLILSMKNRSIKRAIKTLVFFSIFVILISPWLIRNKIEFGNYNISPVGASYQIYEHHVSLVEAEVRRHNYEEFSANIGDSATKSGACLFLKDNNFYSNKVKDSFLSNPFIFTKVYLKTLGFSFISPATQLYSFAFGINAPKVNINNEFSKNGVINVLIDYVKHSWILIFFWLYSILYLSVFYIPIIFPIKKPQKIYKDLFLQFLLLNSFIIMAMNGFVSGTVRYRIPALISLLPLSVLCIAFYMQKRELKIEEKNQV